MRDLNINERQYVETYVQNEKKNILIAYVLWFFVGFLGAHRYYLGKPISATILLIVTSIGGLLSLISFFTLTWLFMLPTTIWLFIDIFLIIPMVSNSKHRARRVAVNDIISERRKRNSGVI